MWVAMHHQRHAHHNAAEGWYESLNEPLLVFCRQTQLGFFRILTTLAVMGDETLAQRQCWTIYEQWLASGFAIEQPEPLDIGPAFRARTFAAEPSPKTWMDAYLAAFAECAGLTLVTFDRTLAAKSKDSILLS
jgi:toxin-antitoxin system PIN domain toxin